MVSSFSAMQALFKRDVLLAFRNPSDLINPILFFVIIVTLFPLAISSNTNLLLKIGPGVIWVAALLSIMLSLGSLFHQDFEDGALEQMLLSPHPLSLLVLAKVLAYWLVAAMPLILVTPVLALMLHFSSTTLWVMMLTLLLGTPTLSFIGAIATALVVGLPRGGVLLSLLVIPLVIPVLIFAAGATSSVMNGLPYEAPLALLGALLALVATSAPIAIAAALRVGA